MRINLFLSDCHQAVSQHSSGHSLLKIHPFSTCSKWFSHTNVHRSSEISCLLLSAKCSGWPGCEPLLSWLGALYSHSHQKAYRESRRLCPFLRSWNGFQNLSCSNRSLQKLPKTTVFQVEMAGYWVQFSTSNNSTSLFDHWLLYRHCAKLIQGATQAGNEVGRNTDSFERVLLTLKTSPFLIHQRSLFYQRQRSIWIWLSQAYLPGTEVNHDHEGGSSRVRPFHCTSVWLTPTIAPNVGNSSA